MDDISRSTGLKNLIENEELLSILYKKYSDIFKSDTQFWIEISKDEIVHASWISELDNKIGKDGIIINDDRFQIEAIINFGKYVQQNIDAVDIETISPINALSIAMDIENSMLERDIFKIYETDNDELKAVLNKLKKSTEIHYSEVKQRWEEERGNSLPHNSNDSPV